MDLTLRWNKLSDTKYDIYKSSSPGGVYTLLDTVESSGEDVEEYIFQRLLTVNNLIGSGTHHTVNLLWDKVLGGSPDTFKIVPYDDSPTPQPLFTPTQDSGWMNDALPDGAVWIDDTGSSWDSNNYFHGSVSLKVKATDGYVYPQFDMATNPITDRYIVVWVYIDPEYVPDSIMITFFDGDWSHRVYWGKDLFPFGTEGTPSMYYMGTIPMPECWTPLVIDKEVIKAGDITGAGFGVYKEDTDGDPQIGIAYFDCIYTSDQPVHAAEQQYIPVDRFHIYRRRVDESQFEYIGDTKINSFSDDNAPDVFGYNSDGYRPNYLLHSGDAGESVIIRWTVPSGVGTQYVYRVETRDKSGNVYDYSEVTASVTTEHDHIKIWGGVNPDHDSLPLLANNETDSEFIHTGLEPETTYYYRLESYNGDQEMTSRITTKITTKSGSKLDFFILDQSSLA